jgi:hypothetical protein
MKLIDHPALRTGELNRRIADELGGHTCWKSDLLWGEYLTLDFGPRRILLGKNGPAAFGEFRILLHEAPWSVERDGEIVFDTVDALDAADNADMDAVFVGRALLRAEWRDGFRLVFSDGVILQCHPESTDEQEFELRFVNGDNVDLYADGCIETESEEP